jgi:hypothetical protein
MPCIAKSLGRFKGVKSLVGGGRRVQNMGLLGTLSAVQRDRERQSLESMRLGGGWLMGVLLAHITARAGEGIFRDPKNLSNQ